MNAMNRWKRREIIQKTLVGLAMFVLFAAYFLLFMYVKDSRYPNATPGTPVYGR